MEDGDIEKKDYIIGNFKNVDPFYEEDEEDDYMYFYTDFNYYDPNLYKEGECDFDDIDTSNITDMSWLFDDRQ